MIAWSTNAPARQIARPVPIIAPEPPPPPRVRDYIIIEAVSLPEPPPEPLPPTMAEIRNAVADYYELERFDMVSARKPRSVAYPRQLAMYLCRKLTPRSLPEIGRAFGGRDHSTVIHAIKMVEARLVDNADVRADYYAIVEALKG